MRDTDGLDPAALDAADPLGDCRDLFVLPADGHIYLDGNSLGLLPKATAERLADVVRREWGEGLIDSWNSADWIGLPQRVGGKIAPLIGARPHEVIACDSTSVNIFKALCAALACNSPRTVLLSETGNFPTDLYMMQGLQKLTGGRVEARSVSPDELESAIDDSVAAVLVTQVHYKTGRMRDLHALTAKAHAAGALIVWDLSHSTGAVDVDLTAAHGDFAVGCGYKYLNGGPGAPAYIYAAERHHAAALPALAGWFGHAAPFAFEDGYRKARGIEQFLAGTPPILGLAALESGLDVMSGVPMAAVRAKSLMLQQVFLETLAPAMERHDLELVSPADPGERGSQLSFRHADAYALIQAMKACGVTGDFREPDIARFGFTPLYISHAEAAEAAQRLVTVLDEAAWDRPEYRERAAVT